MENLIHNDLSRCNENKCPTNFCCARFRQLRFDRENGNIFSVTDFEGRKKNGLCDNFINAETV
jgi:hypothetical protein